MGARYGVVGTSGGDSVRARGSRESLLYRESVLRALNLPKNADKGCWKGMTPEEAYRGLLEEVLELGEELFKDDDMLDFLRSTLSFAGLLNLRDDIDPQRVQEEYDDVGGAHLILGDVTGCLYAMRVDKAGAAGRES